MWNFEREEIADKALAYIEEKGLEYNPLNVVVALDILGLLKDPAVEHAGAADGYHVCYKNLVPNSEFCCKDCYEKGRTAYPAPRSADWRPDEVEKNRNKFMAIASSCKAFFPQILRWRSHHVLFWNFGYFV